jgi:hypothetical protein
MPDGNISRRNALKKLGTSAIAAGALTTGTVSAGGTLSILVWPNRTSDRDEVDNEIFNSLADFLDQLYTGGALDGYSLTTKDTTLQSLSGINDTIDSNCDTSDWFGDFESTVTDDSYNVHVAVTNRTNFASASSDDGWGSKAPSHAFVGTAGGYDSTDEDTFRYKNLAKQEVGHVIIDESFLDYPNTSHEEHALGKVRDDNKSTPMVTYYETNGETNPCADTLGTESENGDCSSAWYWDGTHTNEVTDCTIQAVKDTNEAHGY